MIYNFAIKFLKFVYTSGWSLFFIDEYRTLSLEQKEINIPPSDIRENLEISISKIFILIDISFIGVCCSSID